MAKKSKAHKPEAMTHDDVVRVHNLRSSNAAAKHTPKTRKGTRAAKKSRAISEQF